MDDNRPGDNLGRWGFVFATAGTAIAFVLLILIPGLIWFAALWYTTRGMPAGD